MRKVTLLIDGTTYTVPEDAAGELKETIAECGHDPSNLTGLGAERQYGANDKRGGRQMTNDYYDGYPLRFLTWDHVKRMTND